MFSKKSHLKPILFYSLCLLLIVTGMILRFSWVNWSEGTNLHPDEYGLTNTLTQLSIPDSFQDYFNTRISTISPYNKYEKNGSLLFNGPDNRMRWGQWPIILLRYAGEIAGSTGYDEIRLLGRRLSACADLLTILFLFLTGSKLYGTKFGALAAGLSSLAVMQIQQSHFMTVDNFAALFTAISLYACVQISKTPLLRRARKQNGQEVLSVNQAVWKWILLFGISFGMAMASKINLLPIGGMLLIALFISIADIKLRAKREFYRSLLSAAGFFLLGLLLMLLTFRFTQPMSFRAAVGDTHFYTLQLNPDWLDSMKVAQMESSGIGGGPPSEQWANRARILFPLKNMLFWGMGLFLGLTAWAGFLWAAWQAFIKKKNWRDHLFPLVWVGGFFFFMGTRWVMSMRYFLPIYPFLCLFAAWFLLNLRQYLPEKPAFKTRLLKTLGLVYAFLVPCFTLLWALGFCKAVYIDRNTRVRASEWIIDNIPGAVNLVLNIENQENLRFPLPVSENLVVYSSKSIQLEFTAPQSGEALQVYFPKVSTLSDGASLELKIYSAADQTEPIYQAEISLQNSSGAEISGALYKRDGAKPAQIEAGQSYILQIQSSSPQAVFLQKLTLSNENWDEGLPMRVSGWDPFGQLYKGLTMEVRWYDDENKKAMFLERLAETDYIILPSQRGIWSICRIPRTYPMTKEYYRALFDGSLGFELVKDFSAPVKIGPLYISDVAGEFALNSRPELPLFNFNPLAAEEAFSVYDHPPVWIFKKSADFEISRVQEILDSVDLSKVVVESAREATFP